MQGCGPCAGGGGGRYEDDAPAPPDPAMLAFQQVRPRMIAVIQAMADGFLDRDAWMAALPGTPDAYVAATDRIHRTLVGQASALQRQAAGYNANLANAGQRQREAGRLAELEQDNSAMRAWLKDAEQAAAASRQYTAITEEIEARASVLRAAINDEQRVALAAFSVLLPSSALPRDIRVVIPGPPAQKRAERSEVPEPAKPPRITPGVFPVHPAYEPTDQQPRYDAVPGLSGSLEARTAQIEADARTAREAFNKRNDLRSLFDMTKVAAANVTDRIDRAAKERNQLMERVAQVSGVPEQLRQVRLAAIDARNNERARFVTYAAQEWMWERAEKRYIHGISDAIKVSDYYRRNRGTLQSKLEHMDREEILRLYEEDRFNVLNLPEALSKAVEVGELRDSVLTLLEHGHFYAEEAARLGATGSPGEVEDFVSDMFEGLTDDAREIVKADAKLLHLEGPFAAIAARLFVPDP